MDFEHAFTDLRELPVSAFRYYHHTARFGFVRWHGHSLIADWFVARCLKDTPKTLVLRPVFFVSQMVYSILEQLAFKENWKYQQHLQKLELWNKISPERWEHEVLQEAVEMQRLTVLYPTTPHRSHLGGRAAASLLEARVSRCDGHVLHANFIETCLHYQKRRKEV